MKFYNQDLNNDRAYLEIMTKYNLSYWMAIDLYQYANSCLDDLNKYEYEKILSQYSLAIQTMHEADKLAELLKGDHRDCLSVQRDFLELCLEDHRLDNIFQINIDSESTETSDLFMKDKHDECSASYMNYLSPNSYEYKITLSMNYFSNAQMNMLKFHSNLEFYSNEHAQALIHLIIDDFMSARILLDQCLSCDECHNEVINEYLIMTLDIKKDKTNLALKEYFTANIEFTTLWREIFYLHEEFFKDLSLGELNLPPVDVDFFSCQADQMFLKLNKAALELQLMILNGMGVKMPYIEIYSARQIKSPIDFITYKNYKTVN